MFLNPFAEVYAQMGACGHSYAAQMQASMAQQKAVGEAQYQEYLRMLGLAAGTQDSYIKPKPASDNGCSQCGAKSFRLTSDHGNWKHICSYCGSDK